MYAIGVAICRKGQDVLLYHVNEELSSRWDSIALRTWLLKRGGGRLFTSIPLRMQSVTHMEYHPQGVLGRVGTCKGKETYLVK
jgi:hypothetical protein